jgi:hypothetical protein
MGGATTLPITKPNTDKHVHIPPRSRPGKKKRRSGTRPTSILAPGEITEKPRPDHADGPASTVSYSVRLSRADVERLRAVAARQGVDATSLARSSILRQLAAEEAAPTDPQAVLERLRRDLDDLSNALRTSN